MAGILIPNRDPDTIREYDESFFASPIPVRERETEDPQSEPERG
jgi:hypothetical protein